ncbi:hypothetical protein CENSYa_0632 [Cenarchaeum symbiosum A]|uniref:Uncharacterized protein n=1 Tax=Cenarchaeum symbiosum (strain A) TaxID=414004 RepID=A0RV98_CENSY|nr:hypothetical protein CENSYa_0632 [Cenarchaeum symbiosum A]
MPRPWTGQARPPGCKMLQPRKRPMNGVLLRATHESFRHGPCYLLPAGVIPGIGSAIHAGTGRQKAQEICHGQKTSRGEQPRSQALGIDFDADWTNIMR